MYSYFALLKFQQSSSKESFEEPHGSDHSNPPEIPARPPSETLERLKKCRRPIINEDVAHLEFLSDSTHSDKSDDHSTCGLFGDSDLERSVGFSDIDAKKLKETKHTGPPRVKIERKEYNSAHTSLLSSIASDDTCELVAMAEEILCNSGSNTDSNPSPQTPNSNRSAAEVNRGASTSISEMYSVVKKKSKVENNNKKKPIPPPRSRVPNQDRRKDIVDNGNKTPTSSPRTISSPSSNSPHAKPKKYIPKQSDNSEKQYSSPRKHLNSSNHKLRKPRADNEIHDYAEIYTPSGENPPDIYPEKCQDNRPPTPPLHRCPSWVSF